MIYSEFKVFISEPCGMVFLYNISESISSQCDGSVRGGFAGLFLESLRFRATAYLIFLEAREVFYCPRSCETNGGSYHMWGLQILSGKFKKIKNALPLQTT